MSTHLYEEPKMLSLLVLGNEHAFKEVYHRHRLRVYFIAQKYFGSKEIAEDVVQEVFIQLWCNRTKIKTGLPVEAWLVTVAQNNIFNRLKKMGHEDKLQNYLINNATVCNNDDSLRERFMVKEYHVRLQRAVSLLSGMQLRVYKLAWEENFSYPEIAEYLGISPFTVKTHLYRAIASIKKRLSSK